MKHIKLIIISLFLSITLINAQNNNSIKTIWPQDDTLKQLFGKIGDIPVEIFLKKQGDKINGSLTYLYYYEFPDFDINRENDTVYKLPKNLEGSIKENGEIEFHGYGKFKGKCSEHKIEGIWTDFHKDSLTYPFQLFDKNHLYDDWFTYHDADLGIEFKYPPNATVRRYDTTECNLEFNYYATEYFKNNKTKSACIEILYPVDTSTNLEKRKINISSWIDDSCCAKTKVTGNTNLPDTVYSKKLGNNTYFIQKFTEGAMSHVYETNVFTTCRSKDNRCFLFEYFLETVSLGSTEVPYRDGFYNRDYQKGYYWKNEFIEYNGPKPYNEKLEDDMMEYMVGWFNKFYKIKEK